MKLKEPNMLVKKVSTFLCAALMCAAGISGAAEAGGKHAPDNGSAQMEADKKALAPVLQYVGGWRGVGLPKNGAARDGWSEDSEWQFDLKGGHAALVFATEKGKYYKAGRLEPGEKPGTFKFIGTLPDDKKEELAGEFNKEHDLVLDNASPGEGRPARIEFSMVAKGNRMLLNFSKKMSGERYSPFLEVGYTRKGSGFGKNSDAHECVITGGIGKFEVSYKGKSYWVCCGGCRDAFNENPEKEIAAYMKRKEEEKAKDKK